jgi:hypothetical protein
LFLELNKKDKEHNMGTKSITTVLDETDEIMCMYRQSDGYPSGHGKELADFLNNFKICNGISEENEVGKWANGVGCLAAQIVAHFKTGIGQFYLIQPGTRDCGEEYIYTVYLEEDSNKIMLRVAAEEKVLYNDLAQLYDPKD